MWAASRRKRRWNRCATSSQRTARFAFALAFATATASSHALVAFSPLFELNSTRRDSTETELTSYSLLTSPFLSPRPPLAYAYLFLPPAFCMSNLSESRRARAEPSSIPANLGVMLCYVLLCCAVRTFICIHLHYVICFRLMFHIFYSYCVAECAWLSSLIGPFKRVFFQKTLCIPLPLSA